ncbi:hypothetical protein CDAR_67651 [Caerostris darwini]|uniref:Uncharacterized protein n=1 Tax=Caerostris darwini TaxID=1538125 RepID=A0AAV4TEA0_9ARAC|nr:hypothetical protein CDAR_67651 [Caerostris darwini]
MLFRCEFRHGSVRACQLFYEPLLRWGEEHPQNALGLMVKAAAPNRHGAHNTTMALFSMDIVLPFLQITGCQGCNYSARKEHRIDFRGISVFAKTMKLLLLAFTHSFRSQSS